MTASTPARQAPGRVIVPGQRRSAPAGRRLVVEPRDARLGLRTHARSDAQLLQLLDRLVAA